MKKNSDINDLATTWDFSNAMQQVVPSEDRDFSRPSEHTMAMSYPSDVAEADAPLPNTIKTKPVISDIIVKPSDVIKTFQTFLSKSQPIIGAPYQGPIDGLVNPALVASAKQVEAQIAKALNNKGVYGLLWNDATKTFNTSTTDVTEALQLLSTHVQPTKTAQDRKIALTRIKKDLDR